MSNPGLLRKYSQIVEGYEDSVDFTEEFYGAHQELYKVMSLMKSDQMRDWMDITDSNFGTNCLDAYADLIEALTVAYNAFENLSGQLELAS